MKIKNLKLKICFSIVIPNYNGNDYLVECLKSLDIAIKNCPNIKTEIIIVDNGSNIKPNENIFPRHLAGNIKFIFNKNNLGFGKAINLGSKISIYEYLIIINNDIIVDENWFVNIVKAIKNKPNYACYYGLVLNKDGSKIESTGFKFYKSGKVININNGKTRNSELPTDNCFEIWGAPASIIIYKKTIFNKLKGFDEKYFAYIEDVDLAYRLVKNNYKTLFIPQAISYHAGGATSSKINYLREYMTVKNWWIFIINNYSKKEIIINFFPIIFERLRNLKYLLLKLAHDHRY